LPLHIVHLRNQAAFVERLDDGGQLGWVCHTRLPLQKGPSRIHLSGGDQIAGRQGGQASREDDLHRVLDARHVDFASRGGALGLHIRQQR
jgi:hypothetical protein